MSKKKKTTPSKTSGKVPRRSTVVDEFRIISPEGNKYVVKRTNQMDVYDKPSKGKA